MKIKPDYYSIDRISEILSESTGSVSREKTCFLSPFRGKRFISNEQGNIRLDDLARSLCTHQRDKSFNDLAVKLLNLYKQSDSSCFIKNRYRKNLEKIAQNTPQGPTNSSLNRTEKATAELTGELEGRTEARKEELNKLRLQSLSSRPSEESSNEILPGIPPPSPADIITIRKERDHRRISSNEVESKLEKALLAAQLQLEQEEDGKFSLSKLKPTKNSPLKEIPKIAIKKYPEQEEIKKFLIEKSKTLMIIPELESDQEYLQVHHHKVGVAYNQGTDRGRCKQMQDEHLAIPFEITIQGQELQGSLFGIFDGHGEKDGIPKGQVVGRLAAAYAKEFLPRILKARLENENSQGLTSAGITNAIKLATVDLHEEFALACQNIVNSKDMKMPSNEEQRNQFRCGTTATFLLDIEGQDIYTGNVGDSRIILATPNHLFTKGEIMQLTKDAKIEDEWQGKPNSMTPYANSVHKRGGEMYNQYDPFDLTAPNKRLGGKLETPRVIGDCFLNSSLSSEIEDWQIKDQGINPRAKVTRLKRNQIAKKSRIILSCDALYETNRAGKVSSSKKIGRTVQKNLEIPANQLAEAIVNGIIDGENGGSTDNCSLLIVDF